MQMLGTKYNIEPFFFSSSFGWIPTQYQENVNLGESDRTHASSSCSLSCTLTFSLCPDITITLTFVRCINDPFNLSNLCEEPTGSTGAGSKDNNPERNIAIKTNEYLWLESSAYIAALQIPSY